MNATIARLAWKSLFGQKRGLLLLALPLLLVLFAGGAAYLNGSGDDTLTNVVVGFGLMIVLPVVCLLVANGVLGPEMEDGSVIYLLSKPVSRYVVAASKAIVAALASVIIGAGSVLVAGLITGDAGDAVAVAVAAAVSALAYTGVFIALAAGRRGMVLGVAYFLVLESLLLNSLPGLRFISAGAFGRRVGEAVEPSLALLTPDLNLVYAVIAALVFLVAGTAFAGWQLVRFQLTGDD